MATANPSLLFLHLHLHLLLLIFSLFPSSTECRSTVIHYDLEDEVKSNSFVGNLATDASFLRSGRNDSGHQQERLPGLRLVFLSSPHGHLFHLDSTSGDLYTNARMDRDDICRSQAECKLELNVQAKAEHFSSFVKVLIKMHDVNDNPPAFSKPSVHLNISEAEVVGRKFRIAHASDDDAPENGIARFYLRPELEEFGIQFNNHSHDVTSGAAHLEIFLVIRKPLDRELRPTYQTNLVAEDGGKPPLTTLLPLVVLLSDVNDNAPAFERELYHAYAEENSPIGTSVLHVTAVDADLGEAGEVVYGLEKKLNPSKSINDLQHQQQQQQKLQHQHKQQHKRIPHRHRQQQQQHLEEQEVDGEDDDDDDDEEEGEEWNVWTDEQTGGPLFRVDPRSGLVYVAGKLDREVAAHHVLSVSARDLDSARSKSVTVVKIDVTDVNDNPPSLSSQFTEYNVTENCGPKTFVGLVTVTDPDSPENTRLTCGSDNPTFVLEQVISNQYQLVTSSDERFLLIDRETQSEHRVTVTCTDGSFPPMTGSLELEIRVLDRNDNRPRFESANYSARLRENFVPDGAIIRAAASDEDDGSNGAIRYRLEPSRDQWQGPRLHSEPPNQGQSRLEDGRLPLPGRSPRPDASGHAALDHLEVDAVTGALKVVKPFDRELSPAVKFLLVAHDLGTPPQTSYADVVIFIDDVDDERPIFTKSNFTFSILENQPPDTFVGTVQAYDADEAPFNSFHFFIHRSDIFRLDPTTGALTTLVSLDRELVDSYFIDVFACPTAGGDDCTSAHVTVRIADENDNPPRLVFPAAHLNYTLAITNSFQYGDRVTKVVAEDDDEPGPNSRLVFRAVDTTYFRLNATSGMVTASRTFAVSGEGSVCEFPVVIRDSGEPSRTVEATILFVFNSSVKSYYEMERESGEGNFYIVICIAVTSAFLSTILVVAILFVARKQTLPAASGDAAAADKKAERARGKKKKDHKSAGKNSNSSSSSSSLKLRCQQQFPAKGAKNKNKAKKKKSKELTNTCNHVSDAPFTLNNGYSRNKNKQEGRGHVAREETNAIGSSKHGPARLPAVTTPIPDRLMDDDGDSMFVQNMPEVVDVASTPLHQHHQYHHQHHPHLLHHQQPTSAATLKQRPQLPVASTLTTKMSNRPQVPVRAPGTVTLGCYGDRSAHHGNDLRTPQYKPEVVVKDPFYFTNCAANTNTAQPTSVCFQNNEPKLSFGSFV